MAKAHSRRKPAQQRAAPPPQVELAPVDRRAAWWQAAVLFGVALLVRLAHLWVMRNSPLFAVLVGDGWRYDEWARQITTESWWGTEVFYQTPLYPYLLAVIYSILGHSHAAVRIIQALFGCLACVFAGRAGARFFSEPVGWIAGLMLAFYPPAIFFDSIVQKASLDLVLMTGLLWAVAETQWQPRPWRWGVVGALLGLMTLNRENAAVLFPVLLGWIGWISWPQGAKVIGWRIAALGLAAAAVLLPVGLRNYSVGGTFALTTSQMGTNFYIGNNATANGTYATIRHDRGDARYEAEDARLLAEADVGHPLAADEVSSYWMQRSWQDIRENPLGWLRLLAWKWFLTWNAVELIDVESIHTYQQHSWPLAMLYRWIHLGVVCPVAILGIWFTRQDWRRLLVLYLMLAAFALAVTIFYVFGRYRYPLVPVLVLFAAAGSWQVWLRGRGQTATTSREWLIGGAAALAMAVFSNWSVGRLHDPDSEDAATYYNVGSMLLKDEQLDAAQQLLEDAARLNPRFSATQSNLGRIMQLRGDHAQALRYFEQAVALDGDHAMYRYNLASELQQAGDKAGMVRELRQAVELDPLLVPALRGLAMHELQDGNPQQGISYLQKVAQIEAKSALARAELAEAYELQGNWVAAVQAWREALEREQMLAIGNRLARALAAAPDAAVRNGREAVELTQRMCEATNRRDPHLLDTLAAAYAEVGQFEQAANMAAEAERLASEADRPTFTAHRKLYESRQPLRLSNEIAPAVPQATE